MASNLGKVFGKVPLFDPEEGMLVRSPREEGPGWWAGAPCATFDAQTNTFYLVYRMRQPRDQGRGVECRIAASDNGVSFTDIWALPKTSVGALSLERSCLTRGLDGMWRLYVGYVHPEDRRWRIGMMEAPEPDQLHAGSLRPLLTPEMIGAEGVKDPNVFLIGRMYYLLASYATADTSASAGSATEKHGAGDIFNTGLTRSRTGAAISEDGKRFRWIGDVSPVLPGGGAEAGAWDSYCRRLGALTPMPSGGYLAFYDGGRSVEENYEEKTGIAMTFDLQNYLPVSIEGPALVSPYGSGSLRYIDVLSVGHELFYYYELAREDGSHELRVNVVERD